MWSRFEEAQSTADLSFTTMSVEKAGWMLPRALDLGSTSSQWRSGEPLYLIERKKLKPWIFATNLHGTWPVKSWNRSVLAVGKSENVLIIPIPAGLLVQWQDNRLDRLRTFFFKLTPKQGSSKGWEAEEKREKSFNSADVASLICCQWCHQC